MDSLEYNRRALLTESKPTELNFGEIGLHILMNASINMGEIMNIAKRTMFYGKAFDAEKVRQLAEMQAGYAQLIFELSDKLAEKNDKGNYNALPEEARGIDPKNLNLRLLHCAFGINTESAELLEAMRDQLEGKPFDKVNFAEELATWTGTSRSATLRLACLSPRLAPRTSPSWSFATRVRPSTPKPRSTAIMRLNVRFSKARWGLRADDRSCGQPQNWEDEPCAPVLREARHPVS